MDANLVEIFSSAQGEGPYVGAPTIFVRFGECDLRCAWCDSPGTWRPAGECRIEEAAGSGRFRTLPNPVSIETLGRALDALDPSLHRFASLTGGEPLLQPQAVRAAAAGARARGLRSFLETHGLACEAMLEVRSAIDVVSMDWKLESDVMRAPGRDARRASTDPAESFADLHERFLAAATAACETYVKVVVTPHTLDAELDVVCERVARVAPDTLLVLQPVTPFAKVRERPDPKRVLAWQRRCLARLPRVRVIPQTHPVYLAP